MKDILAYFFEILIIVSTAILVYMYRVVSDASRSEHEEIFVIVHILFFISALYLFISNKKNKNYEDNG